MSNADRSDGELVALAVAGQREAFDELIVRHFDAVFAVAWSRLSDDDRAQDLAQEVFLRAWLNIGTVRQATSLRAWLCQLARNLAINWLRDGTRRSNLVRMVPMDDEVANRVADATPSAAERLGSDEAEGNLKAALDRLSPSDRELVLMHFMEQLSQRDIARRLGVHHTTIGRRLEGVMAHLRRLLSDEPASKLASIKPPAAARAGALAVVAAAAAMPASAQAALAVSAQATAPAVVAGGASAMSWGGIKALATWALEAFEALAMGHKVVAGLAVAATLGSGTFVVSEATGTTRLMTATVDWYNTLRTPSGELWPKFDRTVTWKADGTDIIVDIANGEVVRLDTNPDEIIDDWVDLWALPAGGKVRVWSSGSVDAGGEPSEFGPTILPPPPLGSSNSMTTNGMTNVANDGTGARYYLVSVLLEQTPGGMRAHCYATSRPDLLPAATAWERQYDEGRISMSQLRAGLRDLFVEADALPHHPGNRQLALNLFETAVRR